ncbi:MAG: RHS repeat-associated core domain-containing protein [Acidobacteriota bacterium]
MCNTFQYDPFGQPREISESGGLILFPIYDADGERIGLVTEGSNEWKWTPRDLSGKVAREYLGAGGSVGQPGNFFYVWKEDYVYRGGLLAGAVRETAEGGLRHFHLDHLGTPRVTTNASGQVMSKNDYYPFGQEITSMRQQIAAGYDRDDPMKFTGHERDFIGGTYTENADNLDYMHAREYSAGLARFMSVDPGRDSNPAIPQSWNLYTYTRGNPATFSDPTGMFSLGSWIQGLWDGLVDSFDSNQATVERAREAYLLAADPASGMTQGEAKSQDSAGIYKEGMKVGVKTVGGRLAEAAIGAVLFTGTGRALNFAEGSLSTHFAKHIREFGYATEGEYLAGARAIALEASEGAPSVITKIRGTDTLIYKTTTNEFVVVGKDNLIRTYFKPREGTAYFLNQ